MHEFNKLSPNSVQNYSVLSFFSPATNTPSPWLAVQSTEWLLWRRSCSTSTGRCASRTIDGQMGTRHDTARTRLNTTRLGTTRLDTIHYSCRAVPARRVDSSAHTRHATSLVVSCRHDGTANTPGRVQHGTITFVTQNFSNQTTNRELLTLN
jgi:hypothetical protein